MADKENAALAVAAAGPRVTRAVAKRAAAEAAVGGVPAKRKRVALGEIPALTNSPARAAKKSKPAKPTALPIKKEALKPVAVPVPVPSSPPRAVAAEAGPDSSASSSSLPGPAAVADPSASASSPPRAVAEANPSASASSQSPPHAVAEADPCASASSSPPRAVAEADPSASSPSPPHAVAEADPCASASTPPPPRAAAAPADAQQCLTYASDIYTYLRAQEAEPWRRPRADYIEAVQKDVSANMRAILVDWLVEVAEEYKLVADTLYLAVYYVDRFLSANVLNRDKLQLLGVSAMLIAAKYEEISPPHVEDFCYITDNTYTKNELHQMEADILKLLQSELGNPTIKTFLRRFTRAAQEDKKHSILVFEFLGSYLAELSLLEYRCLQYQPSLVAASVVFLARLTIDPHSNPWNYKLQKMTCYKVSELKDCIIAIHSLQLNRKCSSSTATRDKYKQHKFKCVSTLLPPVVIPTSYFEDLTE